MAFDPAVSAAAGTGATSGAGAAAYLRAMGWSLAPFQRRAMAAYRQGASGLIHAATGQGKTLAAWLGPLADAAGGAAGAAEPLRVLWITPLRALAADTARQLQQAADGSDSGWQVGVRTGDTASAERARQRRRLPQTLVTTPESASLLLSYGDLIPQWRGLRAVVVDEWHELLGSKRGVQTELVLARLRQLVPGLRVWGLSATLGNIEEAAAVLCGAGARVVAGPRRPPPRIDILLPPEPTRFAWSGHLGLAQAQAVAAAVAGCASTLVFTNTRAQAERWFDALRQQLPALPGALHHGALDRAVRQLAERGIADGSLRYVVATSSLDLGVDFAPVEQVIQIGGPKGVARLLQRAGRSGHAPGRESRILCVPTHTLEVAEFSAARDAAARGDIEARRPLRGCLDVLAQHLCTLALAGDCTAESVLAQARSSHAFAQLDDRQWQWLLDFVGRGGGALAAYPQYHKVSLRDGRLCVADATIARRHRMSVGTISADASVRVAFRGGGSLGQVEERFIAQLRPGDSFLFAGRALTLVQVREMTAYVRPGRGRRQVPRWVGGRMPLSSTLAGALLRAFDADRLPGTAAERAALEPLLAVQRQWSALPSAQALLVEHTRSREGCHWFVYPMAGRQAHEALAALVAWRLSRQQPVTCTTAVNDHGFELLAADLPAPDQPLLRRLLSPEQLRGDLLAAVNAAELARRAFRDIARIAGLVFEGYPGRGKSARQVQASSGLIFDVLQRYDPGHLLTEQALHEVLQQQLDIDRAASVLTAAAHKPLAVHATPRLTPLAFPLWAERIGSRLSSEDLATRLQRMADSLERAAGGGSRRRREQAA